MKTNWIIALARAIDVSPVGVKIETFQEIESEMIRLIAVDSDGTLIDIKCRIVHSRQTEEGRYEFGICLAGTELENTRFALKLIACLPKFKQAGGSSWLKGRKMMETSAEDTPESKPTT